MRFVPSAFWAAAASAEALANDPIAPASPALMSERRDRSSGKSAIAADTTTIIATISKGRGRTSEGGIFLGENKKRKYENAAVRGQLNLNGCPEVVGRFDSTGNSRAITSSARSSTIRNSFSRSSLSTGSELSHRLCASSLSLAVSSPSTGVVLSTIVGRDSQTCPAIAIQRIPHLGTNNAFPYRNKYSKLKRIPEACRPKELQKRSILGTDLTSEGVEGDIEPRHPYPRSLFDAALYGIYCLVLLRVTLETLTIGTQCRSR